MKKGAFFGFIVFLILLVAVVYGFTQYSTGSGERAEVADLPVNTEEVEEVMAGTQVEINKEESTFEFEGFSVAKSHSGTFDDWGGFVIVEDGKFVSAEGWIDPASVNTGIEKLDDHLKNEDFFDVEKFPEIKFKTTSMGGDEVRGQLTFRGVTKEVSFPITAVGEDVIAAEFFLDTTPFQFKYTGVNPEVKIKFEFKL